MSEPEQNSPAEGQAPLSREIVDPRRLRTDISLALQMAKVTRTTRDNLAREAFHAVAELIVANFEARGYVVTAPTPTPPGPDITPWQPPNARRRE